MKALIITEPGTATFINKEDPSVGPGEVVLRICMVGYCGTDLNTFRGLNPLVRYPRIPCHELSAVIEMKGPGVPDDLQPGMDVTLSPYTHCGVCPACRQGRFNGCRENQTLGAQRDGGMLEYLAVPWQKLFRSPKLSLRELALVEPLAVGFHAVHRGRVTPQDTVAVLGCGAIGVGVIAGAAFRGARVIAVDIDDRKLSVAKKAGAAETINNRNEPLHEKLQMLTAGDGPDVIIEAIGTPETFQAAVSEVVYAGRVVYVGYAKAPVEYETKYFLLKELDILGSRNALPEDFQTAIKFLESGRFPTEDVITRTYPFEDAALAFKSWSDNPASFTKIQVSLMPGKELRS
jgi:threonine dehydrogenase-like Zn-dependent dehydrogenase